MSKQASAGDAATRPHRLILTACRPAWLGLLLALLAGIAPLWADSPADLFWHMDTFSLAEGGADIPGQITGRPQVQRPTSLAISKRPRVRWSQSQQTPLALERAGVAIGKWETDILRQECLVPLGHSDEPSRWTIGLENRRIEDTIWYARGQDDYRVALTNRRRMIGVAYQPNPEWVIGGLYGWGDNDAVGGGASLADHLDLPAGSDDWPRLGSDVAEYTLGVSRSHGRWEGGLQHTWGDPHQTLRVTRATYHYTAPMASDTHRTEAYLAYHKGAETFFASGWDYRSHGAGTILLGAMGRGDTRLNFEDSSVAIGWRKSRGRRTQQLVLDWRGTELDTYNQGYAGLLPGISADVYALRGSADISTFSLRYGRQAPVADHWTLLSGLAWSYNTTDADIRLRRAGGIGQNPETIGEYKVDGGLLRMLSLSLGVMYESERWRAAFTYTAGYATASEAFRLHKPEEGPPGPPTPGTALKTDYFMALSSEYYF